MPIRENLNTRALVTKEANEDYAVAKKMLGDRNVQLIANDGRILTGKIRGVMRNRVWVNVGDIVLVSYRSETDNKVDIIYKYTEKEISKLKKLTALNFETNADQDENDITFENDSDDESTKCDNMDAI